MDIRDYIPNYIKQTEDKRPRGIITADRWNELWNLNIIQGDYTAEAVGSTITELLALQDALTAHGLKTDNPHLVTKDQVGLGNVLNLQQATKTEFDAHATNVANPHSVTKTQVGLGSVDNTSDMNKPVSTAQAVALGNKVDKVSGKSLLADTEITRLLGIQSGAEVNVQTDWNVTDNTSDAYLKNKPTLGTAAALNTGTTAGTIPLIGAGDKLPLSVIPATAITEVQAFATNAARDLWTTASTGDVAIVASPPRTYIKSGSSWLEMATPTDLVTAVAGRTGNIVLTAADVAGALTALDILNSLASTATDKALSAAQGKALKDAADALATQFSNFVTAYDIFQTDVDTRFASAVLSPTITDIRYYDDKFEYSTDDRVTWHSLTGAKGDTGKGYNPRGAWVANGTYTNDAFTIDVVDYNGASFYCKTTHTASAVNPRTDTVNWGIVADITQLNAVIATEQIPSVLVSSSPVGLTVESQLDATKMLLTGFTVAETATVPLATDDVRTAIGKLTKTVGSDGSTLLKHGENVRRDTLTDAAFYTDFYFNQGYMELYAEHYSLEGNASPFDTLGAVYVDATSGVQIVYTDSTNNLTKGISVNASGIDMAVESAPGVGNHLTLTPTGLLYNGSELGAGGSVKEEIIDVLAEYWSPAYSYEGQPFAAPTGMDERFKFYRNNTANFAVGTSNGVLKIFISTAQDNISNWSEHQVGFLLDTLLDCAATSSRLICIGVKGGQIATQAITSAGVWEAVSLVPELFSADITVGVPCLVGGGGTKVHLFYKNVSYTSAVHGANWIKRVLPGLAGTTYFNKVVALLDTNTFVNYILAYDHTAKTMYCLSQGSSMDVLATMDLSGALHNYDLAHPINLISYDDHSAMLIVGCDMIKYDVQAGLGRYSRMGHFHELVRFLARVGNELWLFGESGEVYRLGWDYTTEASPYQFNHRNETFKGTGENYSIIGNVCGGWSQPLGYITASGNITPFTMENPAIIPNTFICTLPTTYLYTSPYRATLLNAKPRGNDTLFNNSADARILWTIYPTRPNKNAPYNVHMKLYHTGTPDTDLSYSLILADNANQRVLAPMAIGS